MRISARDIIDWWERYGRHTSRIGSEYMMCKFEQEILYAMIRQMKPLKILEIGANLGKSSSATILHAAEDNSSACEIISFDRMSHSRQLDRDANGVRRTLVIGDIRNTFDRSMAEDCELLFIDAEHTDTFAKWYCTGVIPVLSPETPVLIHDWEGYEFTGCSEFEEVKKHCKAGLLEPIINLMDYTIMYPIVSQTPDNISVGKGDRNPTQILETK